MNKVLVGSLGAVFGFKGWIKVNSYTENPSDIFTLEPWHVVSKDNSFEAKLVDWKNHFNKLVVLLDGFNSDFDSRVITNSEIYVHRSVFKQLHASEYYWNDLIGCRVFNKNNYDFGLVLDLFNNGAHDIFVVQANSNDSFSKKERLIPFVDNSVVNSIDLKDKKILVDWDPGF